ncbi:MAG: hypothetical protein ABI551_10680 [Polyangiaceae bacterium]
MAALTRELAANPLSRLARDTGSFDLPATAFPKAGTYSVSLMKAQLVRLASPSTTALQQFHFQIFRDLTVTAH